MENPNTPAGPTETSNAPETSGAPSLGLFARAKASLVQLLLHPSTPGVLGIVLLSVVLSVTAVRFLPFKSAPHIVTFDAVKFLNAQRTAASLIATNQATPEMALAMSQVARQVRSVILEESGGALVVIRQSVVNHERVYDITDKVLIRFGLPTDIPTVSGPDAQLEEELAPSNLSMSRQMDLERFKEQLRERDAINEKAMGAQKAQNEVLP